MADTLLPPAVVRLIADTTAFAASLAEATAELQAMVDAAAAAEAEAAATAATAVRAAATESAAAAEAAATSATTAAEASAGSIKGLMAEAMASAETTAADMELLAREQATAFVASYEAAAAAAKKSAAEQKAAQEEALAGAQEKISKFGKYSALAIVAVGAASVDMAAKFDASMEQVHTAAGASQGEVDKLKGSVLNLASTTGQGPDQLAAGLYHVESAGYRGAQAMDILSAAAKVATIGNANLEDTAQAMIATVASGIGGVRDMNDAAALLNTTVGIGDMRMSQLAKAMATGILPTAATAGLKFTDVAAALATLTDNATPADQVATHLRMTLTLMAAPTDKAAKALAGIGMSQTQLAMDMRQPNGLLIAVEDLRAHLGAMQTDAEKTAAMDTLAKAFGGGKTAGSIMTLIQELPRLQDKYKALGDSTSRAAGLQESWTATQATFKNSLDRLKSSAEVLGIELGNKLIPPLEHVIEWFAKHKTVAEALVITLGVLMGLSIAVWIYGIVAAVVEATIAVGGFTIALLANPITWIVLAIAAAIALVVVGIYELVKHWAGFTHGMETTWNATIGALETAWHAVASFFVAGWDGAIGGLKAAWGGIVTAWHAVGSALSTAWHATLSALEAAAHPFVVGFTATIHGLETAWHATVSALETAWRVAWKAIKTAASDTWHVLEPIFKGLLTAINITLIPLRLLVAFWLITFKAIAVVVNWLWHSVLVPFVGAVTSMINGTILTVLHWLETAWNVTWHALGNAVNWVWNSVLSPTFHFIANAFSAILGTALRWLETAWHATWSALGTAVNWVWTSVLQPTFHFIANAFDAVIGFALRALETTWKVVWGGIQTALSAIWNGFLSPTFHAIATAFDAVIGFGLRLLEATWHSVWGNIQTAVSTVWNGFLSPTFHTIATAFDAVIGVAGRAFQATWNGIWGGIKSTVDWVWSALKGTFDSISRAIRDIAGGIAGVVKSAGGFVGTLNKVLPSIPGLADGGPAPAGRAVLVGERGPELAVFGAPAYIHPAGETKSMLAGGKAYGGWVGSPSGWGGGGQTVIVNQPDIIVQVDGKELFRTTQKQALQYNRRNPSNGLARLAGP